MSLLLSAYDPTNTYLASAIVELDSHRLRVQLLRAAQSSLNTAFKLAAKLTLMTWGLLQATASAGLENEFIALGLSLGVIQIYLPFLNAIVAELVAPSNLAVADLHYSEVTRSLWLCDGAAVYEWDVATFLAVRTLTTADLGIDEHISKLATIKVGAHAHLLIATHSVYLYDLTQNEVAKTFPAHIQPVNTLIPLGDDLFLTSAAGDRFINLYSISKLAATLIFVTQLPVVSVAAGLAGDSVLAAITEEGRVEVFHAFARQAPAVSASRKKRRQVQLHSCLASVRVVRPAAHKAESLAITSATVHDLQLVVSWLEHASVPHFDTVAWATLARDVVLEHAKPNATTTQHSTYGHDIAATKHYNEANAIVSDGTNLRDVVNDSDDEDELLAELLQRLGDTTRGSAATAAAAPPKAKRKLGATTTLTVILLQALRSNDHLLLETVLANRDPTVIRSTIAKLDSALAVTLLDRLAERVARQTLRFDQLHFWLKWIIIVHGAILAGLPNLSAKLSSLHAILLKKADVLPRLMELQGRLNLLHQQTELRREIIEDDELVADVGESDVEYIEELADAEFNGEIDAITMEDDYKDEDDEDEDEGEEDEDEDEDDEDEEHHQTPEDEEAYSDVET